MDKAKFLSELRNLVRESCGHMSTTITEAQYDGDNDSAEVVFVTEDAEDGHQEWVISSTDVKLPDEDTVWVCPECGQQTNVSPEHLAEIGTPHCPADCEEVEMILWEPTTKST